MHDALVVGQSINQGTDERVILFVKLGDGIKLSHELVKALEMEIRAKRSARHVPEKVPRHRVCAPVLFLISNFIIFSDYSGC